MRRTRHAQSTVLALLFAFIVPLPQQIHLADAIAMLIDDKAHEFPFVMPVSAQLRASQKTVFAHYFTSFPRSLDIMTSSVLQQVRSQLVERIS